MRAGFLCVSVLRVVSGPWVKLARCKSALPPTPLHPRGGLLCLPFLLFVLLFVALWFILRGDLFYVLASDSMMASS